MPTRSATGPPADRRSRCAPVSLTVIVTDPSSPWRVRRPVTPRGTRRSRRTAASAARGVTGSPAAASASHRWTAASCTWWRRDGSRGRRRAPPRPAPGGACVGGLDRGNERVGAPTHPGHSSASGGRGTRHRRDHRSTRRVTGRVGRHDVGGPGTHCTAPRCTTRSRNVHAGQGGTATSSGGASAKPRHDLALSSDLGHGITKNDHRKSMLVPGRAASTTGIRCQPPRFSFSVCRARSRRRSTTSQAVGEKPSDS